MQDRRWVSEWDRTSLLEQVDHAGVVAHVCHYPHLDLRVVCRHELAPTR